MKKVVPIGIIATALLYLLSWPFITVNAAAPCQNNIVIFRLDHPEIEGTRISTEAPKAPYIVNGHMFVPLRALSEAIQAEISWNEESKEITIEKDQRWIRFQLNSDQADANGQALSLPAPVASVEGLSYGPVRIIADALQAETTWNNQRRSATISSASHCGQPFTVQYSFQTDTEGWTADFADVPVDYDQDSYKLQFERASLANDANKPQYGLLLSGTNQDEGLFLYASKKIGKAEGLLPDTIYNIRLKFEIATNMTTTNLIKDEATAGAVYVKAGIVNRMPETKQVMGKDNAQYYRINLDKGQPSESGKEMHVLGEATKLSTEQDGYEFKTYEKTFTAKTSRSGELYIMIGTDSNLKGESIVYITEVKADFRPVTRTMSVSSEK